MTGTGTTEEPGFDSAERDLCADDTCIGVIGPDGRCKVCGRPGLQVHPDSYGAEPYTDEQGPEAPIPAPEEEPEDFSDRRLCPDDACIGLIGPHGRCKVCGLSVEPAS